MHELVFRPNNEFYYKTKDMVNKQQLQLYRHIVRYDDSRLTNRIFNKQTKHKTKLNGSELLQNNMKENKTTQDTVMEKDKFKSTI